MVSPLSTGPYFKLGPAGLLKPAAMSARCPDWVQACVKEKNVPDKQTRLDDKKAASLPAPFHSSWQKERKKDSSSLALNCVSFPSLLLPTFFLFPWHCHGPMLPPTLSFSFWGGRRGLLPGDLWACSGLLGKKEKEGEKGLLTVAHTYTQEREKPPKTRG